MCMEVAANKLSAAFRLDKSGFAFVSKTFPFFGG